MNTVKLEVWRTLSTAGRVKVGVLAKNQQGIFFQYDESYLNQFPQGNLSPFKLVFNRSVQLAPRQLFEGLHSVFADSLPDGWGRLLMDRVFTQHQIPLFTISPLERLAYVGDTAIGALSYYPISDFSSQSDETILLSTLGLEAQAIFDGQTDEVLGALAQVGSSGGARPKAQVFFTKNDDAHCHTKYRPHDEPWLVKFTSKNLPLQHDEGLCEAVYLRLAEKAGIDVPVWRLLDAPKKSGATQWLATKRFDCVATENAQLGRKHTLTICGLLEANFREPCFDYLDLIKVSNLLCQDMRAGQMQFRRAMFNLYALNQDDHTKNFAFLQNDKGEWQLSPCYDVTFSPSPYGEHMTSYAGFGKSPPLAAIQTLAYQANLEWKDALLIIDEVREAISHFAVFANEMEVSKKVQKIIQTQLNQQAKLTYR